METTGVSKIHRPASAGHTPGPWFMSYDQGSHRDIMTKNARICTLHHGYVSKEEYQANAALIAAAPELLEALKGIIKWTENTAMHYMNNDSVLPRGFDKWKNLIAKAEGRDK